VTGGARGTIYSTQTRERDWGATGVKPSKLEGRGPRELCAGLIDVGKWEYQGQDWRISARDLLTSPELLRGNSLTWGESTRTVTWPKVKPINMCSLIIWVYKKKKLSIAWENEM